MFDCLEDDGHSYSNPCDCNDHTDKLNTEAMESTANKKTFPFCACTI